MPPYWLGYIFNSLRDNTHDPFLTRLQCGLFGLAGIVFEMLKYGGGVDLWNVSVAHSKHFKKVGYPGFADKFAKLKEDPAFRKS